MAPATLRPLDGRVAVITGGARGIGRAIALRLARDGAHCVITYRRSVELAAAVVEEIERDVVKGLAVPLELTEPSQMAPAFERIGDAFGRVDILVANAAATAFRPLAERCWEAPRPPSRAWCAPSQSSSAPRASRSMASTPA